MGAWISTRQRALQHCILLVFGLLASVCLIGCPTPIQYQPQDRTLRELGPHGAQQQLQTVLSNAITPRVTSAEVIDNTLRYQTPVGNSSEERKLPLQDVGDVSLFANHVVYVYNRDKSRITPFRFKNAQDAKTFIDLIAFFRTTDPSSYATTATAVPPATPAPKPAVKQAAAALPPPSVPTKRPPTIASGSSSERRIALVIGNAKYQHTAPLKNPVNDAQDIAKVLKELNFQVTLKTDATLTVMQDAVFQFSENLKGGGIALFYYAGHGIQVKGENYLIPIDAHLSREDQIKSQAMNARDILEKLDEAKSHLNLVFLDACRNNPFPRSFRSASRGLVSMNAPSGTLLVFATNPDNTAADGSGRNGVYTKHLMQYIKQPGLEVGIMLRKVRTAVKEETGGQQTPWENGSIEGEFYFN